MRLFLAAFMLINCSLANAMECRSSKGENGHWTWRLIDGRKCWYPGRASLDKAKLHWSNQRYEPAKLETCCWPPLEKAN